MLRVYYTKCNTRLKPKIIENYKCAYMHTHLNRWPWLSLHGYGMFIPKMAATKEYTDKHTVPELRNSSSCTRKELISKSKNINRRPLPHLYHIHISFVSFGVLIVQEVPIS